MSVSLYVTGFVPPDSEWRAMKKIWDACEAADVEVPKKVVAFFNHESPDESGVSVDLTNAGCVKDWSSDYESGYEVDLAKVPEHVKIIRCYLS